MKAVGIRELKNNLSRYVAEARRGGIVLVTDRGEVVAELRPAGLGAAASVPRGIEAMVARGEAILGLPHDPRLYGRITRCGPGNLSAKLLEEERGEG